MDEAERLLRGVLASDPDHLGALAQFVVLQEQRRTYEEGAETARHYISLAPESDLGYFLLSCMLLRTPDREGAREAARRAVELAPRSAQNHRQLALVLLGRPDSHDEALAAADEAVRLEPETGTSHLRRSATAASLGQWRDAQESNAQALRLDPESSEAQLLTGVNKLFLARYREAAELFAAYFRQEHRPEKIQNVISALEGFGVPVPLADVYARACEAVGRPDLTVPGAAGDDASLIAAQCHLACRMLVGARDGFPWSRWWARTAREIARANGPAARGGLAWLQLTGLIGVEDGDPGVLFAFLRERPARYVVRSRTYEAGVRAYLERGEVARALELADEAVERCPGDGALAAVRARALLADGRTAEALEACSRAVELWPDSPVPLVELAAVQRASGRAREAIATLDRALERAFVPAHHLIVLDRAEVLGEELGSWARVERELTRARLPKSGGRRRLLVGRARYATGKWARAAQDFRAVLDTEDVRPGVLRAMRDVLAPTRGYGPFLGVYRDTLAALGEAEPAGPVSPDDLADTASRLLRVYALTGDEEALRWAGALAADAQRLSPRHTCARRVAVVANRPRAPESREVLAALRAERRRHRRRRDVSAAYGRLPI